MERSHNGWRVSPDPSEIWVHKFRVPEIHPDIYLSVRKGVAPVLLNVAADFHREVDNLGNARYDDGGYNYRMIPGTSIWSNHASGTAIDLNWSKFPMGVRRMTPRQVSACQGIVARYKVIRWGGDWPGTGVDQMHFEIAPGVTKHQVARVIRELGLTTKGRKH